MSDASDGQSSLSAKSMTPTVKQPQRRAELLTQKDRVLRVVSLISKDAKRSTLEDDMATLAITPEERERNMAAKFESYDLWRLADTMRNHVRVRDRMYHFKVYPKCFVGFEAAKWLVKNKYVDSTEEAEYLGTMLVTSGLIFHVCDDHEFKAQYLFYRFAADETRVTEFDNMKLVELEAEFRENMNVRDISHLHKTYRNVFVGSEAVSYLVESGWCANRGQAIRLGQLLQHSGVFRHVTDSHDFDDENNLFYTFSGPDVGSSTLRSLGDRGSSTASWGLSRLKTGSVISTPRSALIPSTPRSDFAAYTPR